MGQGYLFSSLLFNTMLETLARGIKSEKEIKVIRRRKNKVEPSLLDDMIPNSKKNPKYSIRKLLDMINTFNKMIGYNMNIQKSGIFLYTNKELSS